MQRFSLHLGIGIHYNRPRDLSERVEIPVPNPQPHTTVPGRARRDKRLSRELLIRVTGKESAL